MKQLSIEEAASILELSVDDAADPNIVKAAYRRLSLMHHPDKGGNGESFKMIAAAYSRRGRNMCMADPISGKTHPLAPHRFMNPAMNPAEEDEEEDFVLVHCFCFFPAIGHVKMAIPMPRSIAMEMMRREKEAEMREREKARQDRILLLSLPCLVDPSSFVLSLCSLKFSLAINKRIIVLSKPSSRDKEEQEAGRPLFIDKLELMVQIREVGGGGGEEKASKKKRGKKVEASGQPWREVKVQEEGPGHLTINVLQPSTSYFIRARIGENQLSNNLKTICAWGEWGQEVSFSTNAAMEPEI
jgi:hypothetical protein